MKRLIVEEDGGGLESYLGKRITLFCMNYFYTGDLIGVNDSFVELENHAIVYETGEFSNADWQDAQELPHNWCVQIAAIESWGIMK